MTPAQHNEIERLRAFGMSYAAIGSRIGMSPGAVSWYCLRHAIEPPKPGKCWEGIKGPPFMKRGAFLLRRFTADEDAKIIEMERRGASLRQMARVLGRKDNSIRGRLMTLARREKRRA